MYKVSVLGTPVEHRLLRAMTSPMHPSLRRSVLVLLCDHWCLLLLEILFRWYKGFKKKSYPARFVVFVSKTVPMRTLSPKTRTKFKSGLSRSNVCSLRTSVHLPSLWIVGLVTKYWLLPTSAQKPASCEIRAMVFVAFALSHSVSRSS